MEKAGAEKSPIQSLTVHFDLPFAVLVLDSFERASLAPGYEDYTARVDGVTAGLRFKKRVRDRGGATLVASEDPGGLLTYSQVQVWYEPDIFELFPFKSNYRERADDIRRHAIRCANRFLEVYAAATEKPWARRVKSVNVVETHFILRTGDGKEDPFHYGTGGTGVMLGSTISPEQDRQIRDALARNLGIDAMKWIAMEVADLRQSEEYRSAAVLSATYFEGKFARMLRSQLGKAGLNDAQIADRFLRSPGRPKAITGLIIDELKEQAGINPRDPACPFHDKWVRWESDARDLRNGLVHGTRANASLEDLEKCITATRELLTELEGVFPDKPAPKPPS